MADDIAQWLEGLGLGRYARAFAENDIDHEVLSRLTDDDLKELGLSIGHRRRLQAAVETLAADRSPARPEAPRVKGRETRPAEAERRQLTVLFCDLVGSTALSARLDPEDMREVLRAYQSACAAVISRYDGYVAKFMGDGVYAYFGYPRAHEDDAERAISAGLGIVEAVGALKHELHVRIGVATGTVAVGDIVGEGASEEANVVGDAPNLAARLQEITAPDTVVIGESTHSLAGGLFETTDLGRRTLKGLAGPVGAWAVVGPRRMESRFEATRGERLTALVGREEEMEILLRRWTRAKAREGQVVLISGEPGIGKSRLAQELQDRIAAEPHYRVRHQCSPYHTNSALHPVIEQLERAAGLEPGEGADARLDKLEALLATFGQPVEDAAPLIASMLSLPTAKRYPPTAVSPQRQKELTLLALVDQLSGLARQQPVLFVFEDAQWTDPTTLELLDLMVERVVDISALMLITYRPEFDAPWVGRSRVTPMILGRLDRGDCASMVERVWSEGAIARELRDRIAAQADGVPLFIEELTKAVLESGIFANTADASGRASPDIAIPATLQDALEARLDRLGAAREIAQIGAVIGRTFDYRLLSRLASFEGSALDAALEELVRADLLTVRGAPPDAKYAFKHGLVHDTAYRSLLRRRRTELHGTIAEALEDGFPEIVETEPETLAYHHTEGGDTETAVDYWQRAGRRAAMRSADVEASQHLRKALELLEGLPEGPERLESELETLIALGPVVMNLRGSASSEVTDVYARARELCDRSSRPAQRFPVIWGLWSNSQMGGDSETALSLAHEAIGIAEALSDRDLLLQAHHSAWTSQMLLGDFGPAMQHADRGLALYDLGRHRAQIFTYGGHDAGVCAGALSAHAVWFLGFPDQALTRSHDSVALARRTAHPFSIAHALNFAAMLRLLRRELEEAAQISDELIAFSTENGLAIWRSNGAVLRGWARSLIRRSSRELDELREAVRQREETGSRVRLPIHLAALAHASSLTGEPVEARQVIDRALREVDETGELWWETLIHWVNGEIQASGPEGNDEQVAACYRRTCEVARRQQARTMELRASTSLARLAMKEGGKREAYDLLAPIYGWFTEGFDTADLKDAKALLDELGGAPRARRL